MMAVEIDQVLLAGGRLRPGQIAGVLRPNLFLVHRPVVHLNKAADHSPASLAKEEHGIRDQSGAAVADYNLEGGVLAQQPPLDRQQLQVGPPVNCLPNGQQELGGQNLVDNAVSSVPLFRVAASPIDAGSAPLLPLGGERLAKFSDAPASDIIDFRKQGTDTAGRRGGKVSQRLQFFQVPPGGPIGT